MDQGSIVSFLCFTIITDHYFIIPIQLFSDNCIRGKYEGSYQ